ncbi:MAG: Fic family protein [Acidobacteria bacterium]|nr:Fic family protein [Acidobacteriota bacterium]
MPDFSNFPEVFVSDSKLAAAVSRETKLGRLRKIGSRLYTRNLKEQPEKLVQRNLWPLVDAYLPGALIADRTALEGRPAADGSVFLIADHKREIALPGVTLRPRKGAPPLESDRPFAGSLRLASPARAFLENMRPSRARRGIARTIPKREIEERLDQILRGGGEPAIQRVRDEARRVADQLGMPNEFQTLDTLIGTLLGTRESRLSSPAAIARAAGSPYDPERMDLFQKLFAELAATAPVTRPTRLTDGPALPFFEAYFSNFIEGTEFAVDEAAAIIFKGQIPRGRPEDAHGVLGTWKLVSDNREMSRLPATPGDLVTLLKTRHAQIMEGRPEKGPGQFKADPNRAGSTLFVSPELVYGTLFKGFEMYRGLASPLHRAIFMMFLVTEVHPFADGNGRVARIMMNAELAATAESRIIVPTVFRNNYLAALKALSQNKITGAIVRTLDFAQRYTAAVDFAELDVARHILDRTHAFMDPNEAEASGIRLLLPTAEMLADRKKLADFEAPRR